MGKLSVEIFNFMAQVLLHSENFSFTCKKEKILLAV